MKAKSGVHQILPNLAYGDAIGNEVFAIRDKLRSQGFESEIFAGIIHPRLMEEAHEYKAYRDYSSSDNILIYHFSVGSEIAEYVSTLPDRLVVLYHNVTPPRWFDGINPHMVELSVRGEMELKELASCASAAWADSTFNASRMEDLGYPAPKVLPIVTSFDAFSSRGCHLTKKMWKRPGVSTILFVGRVSPNKCHEDLIRAYAAYRRWGTGRGRLICVGDYNNCRKYYDSLRILIRELRVPDVYFTGMVTFDELLAFYRIADLFFCMSRHEGFCVPLLEAFTLGIPVAAYHAGAVSETMDGAGVLIKTEDPVVIGELLDKLLHDKHLRKNIIKDQYQRMERYSSIDLGLRLQTLIEQVP